MTSWRHIQRRQEKIAERFARETAGHEMTILHDDGLYRHIRFVKPKSICYWFDLVTVPHALIFRGDGESFVFSRLEDMFHFFRDSSCGRSIEPDYWAEKLTSDRDSVMKYDQELFERKVKEYIAGAIRDGSAPRGIGSAVMRDIFEWGDITHEEGARRELESFDHDGFCFEDAWEWNFRDYDWWFLWACHAIVWGIARYDRITYYGLQPLAATAKETPVPDMTDQP